MIGLRSPRHTSADSGAEAELQVFNNSLLIGVIRSVKKRSLFRFFPGAGNEVAFVFEHRDVCELLAVIATKPWRSELNHLPPPLADETIPASTRRIVVAPVEFRKLVSGVVKIVKSSEGYSVTSHEHPAACRWGTYHSLRSAVEGCLANLGLPRGVRAAIEVIEHQGRTSLWNETTVEAAFSMFRAPSPLRVAHV